MSADILDALEEAESKADEVCNLLNATDWNEPQDSLESLNEAVKALTEVRDRLDRFVREP